MIKQDRLWIQLLNGLSNIAQTNNAPNRPDTYTKELSVVFLMYEFGFSWKDMLVCIQFECSIFRVEQEENEYV